MTSSSEHAPSSVLLRGGATGARPATFGRQLAPLRAATGTGDPAEWLAGRDAGYEAGRAEAAQEQAAWVELARAREESDRAERARLFAAALDGLTRSVDAADRGMTVADVLETATRLAVDIAEALVGHHLEVGGCAARDAVLRAMAEVPRGGAALVRVNPADVALVAPTPEALAELAPGADVELVADATLERGGCVVEVGDRVVDARIEAALARVREVLER